MTEYELWKDTPEWELAKAIHKTICRDSHAMDRCWGLDAPYDTNQPKLSLMHRDYLTRALKLLELTNNTTDTIYEMLDILAPGWKPPAKVPSPEIARDPEYKEYLRLKDKYEK